MKCNLDAGSLFHQETLHSLSYYTDWSSSKSNCSWSISNQMFLWHYTVGIVHRLVSNASWWQNAVRCWRTQISGKSIFEEWKVLIWTHAYLLKDWTWIGHFTTSIFEQIIKLNRSNLVGYSHSNKLTASHGVRETLDMLPAMASSASTMLHLWQEFFCGLSILHCHGHMWFNSFVRILIFLAWAGVWKFHSWNAT